MENARQQSRQWLWLSLIVAAGLGVRLAGATGGLWLDEAWSAKLAHDAGTPLGVMLSINHDNNHHLNSLWLQFVGFGAPPLVQRALSIVTGTLAIPVAAMIAAPRGRVAALVAAALFALSPMLVTLGSEARGYAPMALALLSAILMVDRKLCGEDDYRPARGLALAFALGALSQLTMVFGVVALLAWYGSVIWQRDGFKAAVLASLRLFGPALIALAVVLGVIAGAALASPTGFQFGRYEPFGLLLFLHALVEMVGYTVGLPVVSGWTLVVPLVLLVLAARIGGSRISLYRLAIFAFPVALAVLHAGNVGHPRYYLVAAVALLLMLAEMIAAGLVSGSWRRWLAGAGLAGMLAGSVALDTDLIVNQRGDPGAAIRAVKALAPGSAVIILDRDTGLAMLESAAARARYPLRIVTAPCPPQRFLFVDRFKGETMPDAVDRCGARYQPVARAIARGLSGTHWTLYERRR